VSALTRAFAASCLVALLASACGGDDPVTESESVAESTAESGAEVSDDDDDVTVIGTTVLFEDETLPTAEALKKYEAECAGETTPNCKQLQWQLEFALYEDMRELARTRALDDELIRAGAAADSPQLKSFALDRMLARGLRADEHALAVAAFDDPYPLVRGVAQQLARQLPDQRWTRMLERDSGLRAHGLRGLIAGVAPDARSLGAPLYPDATHWHFASSPEYGEFFTTSDSAEDVVAFYAKDGGEALTADELGARIDAARSALSDPALIAQKMQEAIEAGQSPEAVMASITGGADGFSVAWTEGIEGREGMLEPRYLVLAEEQSVGGALPARVVAIFRDEAMDATGLIFRNKPRAAAAPDLSTPEAIEEFQRRQQILGSLEPPQD
jgi:hypothetical protein